MSIKNCVVCGGEFERVGRERRLTCSEKCQTEKRRKKARQDSRMWRARNSRHAVTKTCVICEGEFTATRTAKTCSERCSEIRHYERGRTWRLQNPEKSREYGRRYSTKHRDEQKQYAKEYRKKNADKISTRNKQHRKENPEREREKQRRWRAQNLERARENGRRWKNNNQDRYKELKRRWRLNNPEKVRERNRISGARRTAKILALKEIEAKLAQLEALGVQL